MEADALSFADLERLAASTDVRDRAFAASALRLGLHAARPDDVAGVYERIRGTARTQHAGIRARIQDGTLDKRAFVADLREAPLEIRDHLLEEILDVAYPPLERSVLPAELNRYSWSGLSEILFMLERADLGPEKTFVDLGSGLGKVVLSVALLTGARACGVELDPPLVIHARSAARSLGLENARFIEGDIREAPLPPGDVYYMYIPLLRSADVVERLAPIAAQRRFLLFSQTLDLKRSSWLRSGNAASYWLEMYESRV